MLYSHNVLDIFFGMLRYGCTAGFLYVNEHTTGPADSQDK